MKLERLVYLRRENSPTKGDPGWWMALCEKTSAGG